MNLPKYYANVCEEMPPEYSDYENYEVKFGYYSITISLFVDPKKITRSLKRSEEENIPKYMKE